MTTTTRRIHDAVVILAAVAGILFFWLLSRGAVSHDIAITVIPLCFLTVMVTIVSAVLHGRRK